MDAKLNGKVALVTGGGSGIGKGIAIALAKEGVNIAFATHKPYPETVEKIKSYGVKALWIKTDVSNEHEVCSMIDETINTFKDLDLYINNVAAHWDEKITEISTEGFMQTIKTNLLSCMWACRELSKYFIEKRKGSILIIGSTTEYKHNADLDEASYRVSKVALKYYMKTLGMELAPYGIRVNMIIPGFFETKLTEKLGLVKKRKEIIESIPLKKSGDIYRDIGPTAVLLLSDHLSAYTTCSDIVIDGGIKEK